MNRHWVPQAIERSIEERANAMSTLSHAQIEASALEHLVRHERFMDEECLNLYAGTNMPNPKAARFLGSTIGMRPSLGYPGAKYETGMADADQLEIMAGMLLRRLFRCRFAEFRVPSGSIANLYAYMACTKPGDTIMALAPEAGGHVTHHAAGAAGLLGLKVEYLPYNAQALRVDVARSEAAIMAARPSLIILGGSLNLFPHPVAEMRALADRVGAHLLYDAAHMSGLIAGGCFQDPLREGAHLITSSTYKAFGGPPAGVILTDDAPLAQKLDAIAYPGLTANFDLGKTGALIIAALDMLEYGPGYGEQMIANAQRLAAALIDRDVPVRRRHDGVATQSHHLAIDALSFGGGSAAALKLEAAAILASGFHLPGKTADGDDYNGVRLGTQEVTRWGLQEVDMAFIAGWIADTLFGRRSANAIRGEILEFRKAQRTLHYIRT